MRKNPAKPFWDWVVRGEESECWLWIGALGASGYGRYSFPIRSKPKGKRHARAHRVAYELTVGQIPEGYFVCHHCDNPPCCNPKHLFIGTARDNAVDRENKGRHQHAATTPRKYSDEQVAEVKELRALGLSLLEIESLIRIDFRYVTKLLER